MSLTIGTPDSATISTTEYSLFADGAGPTAQTPDLEKAWVHLDLSALVAGDRFVYKWYEKVDGAGTQRVTRQGYLEGPAFPPHQTFESPGPLAAGYDFTLDKESATDRAIGWRIDTQDGAGGAGSTAGYLDPVLFVGNYTLNQSIVMYFRARTQTGAPVTFTGTPTIRVWRDGDIAQKTTDNGITIDDDFDASTGIHKLTIDTSNATGDAGFWRRASHYIAQLSGITANTVGSLSVQFTFGIELTHEQFRTVTAASAQSTGATQIQLVSGYVTATDDGQGDLLQALDAAGEARVLLNTDTDDFATVDAWFTTPASTVRYNIYKGMPRAATNTDVNVQSVESAAVSDVAGGVWSAASTDPTALPGTNAAYGDIVALLGLMAKGKITINRTTGAVTVYESDGATTLATGTDSDNGTTYTKGALA
jgi:hypothetical protein